MLRLLLPLLLALLGTGAGVGAGMVFKPDHEAVGMPDPCGDLPPAGAAHGGDAHDGGADGHHGEGDDETAEYVKLDNQFVVPVVHGEKVEALVVLSLSVETAEGQSETVFAREPKLRDIFLQVLFDHANSGGFRGAFTDSSNLDVLRQALLESVRQEMGGYIHDVLITDIARQDV